MKKGIAIAAALISLSGCANKVWNKYGATQQEFYQDRAECLAMSGPGNYQINTPNQTGYGNFNSGFQQGWNSAAAIGAASASGRIFNDCMMGRGWSLVSEREATQLQNERHAMGGAIAKAVEQISTDPFESQSSPLVQMFWHDLERQVPNFRQINDDPRFHKWLAVTDSTTGLERQQLLEQAQKRHDADTVAAMFRQFLRAAQ